MHFIIVFSLSQKMTKRPSPFEPNICRQLKIHLNNYENDSLALKDVRDQTLKMLFEGPKKMHSNSFTNGRECQTGGRKQIRSNKTIVQKPVTNYITINGRKVNQSDGIIISPIESASSCFFCDLRTNLTFQCIHCLEFYCTDCSFISYGTFEDKRICLSCS